MFPKNIKFVSTPSQLQQAVESLPEPKGKARRSASKDNALRSKILQIETSQLRQWKLKPAMLKSIPALAREMGNAVLQEKVLAIAITSLENMDGRTLMDVLSLYWNNEEFRLAFNAHCVRQPPTDHTWLSKYYKSFRTDDPPQAIADTIETTQTLYDLHKSLNMQTSSPLFVDICRSYVKRLDVSHVYSWPWVTLMAFLQSGYPLDVRQQIFEWVVIEYIGESTGLSTILESDHLMTLLSMRLLPKDRSQRLPQHLRQLLKDVQKHQHLGRWLSGSDLESWRDLIPFIRSILLHRPSAFLCAIFGYYVLIWPMSKRDSTISVVSLKDFRHRLQSKLRQSIPIALSHSYVLHSLDKEGDWSSEFLQWHDARVAVTDKDANNLEQR